LAIERSEPGSPLTDPRALAVSLVVNGALLALASLVALGVVLPREVPPEAHFLKGELDPTDNRATDDPGGAPGENGGEGVSMPAETRPARPVRDAATALLEEVLPKRVETEPTRALPGPSSSGLGLISSAGGGGGAGEGTGSRGGTGRGIGPGTEFFGLRDRAGSYAYAIDCSSSMTTRAGTVRGGMNSLDVAKRELLASLDPLPRDSKFGVVFYNDSATVFTDPAGRKELMTASPSNKTRLRTKIADLAPLGGTDQMAALRAALALRPEVIFYLTDADFFDRSSAVEIRREMGTTRLLAVEFGVGPALKGSDALRWLAESTGGAYKYIDTRNVDAGPR
jgi:hypothetical protein